MKIENYYTKLNKLNRRYKYYFVDGRFVTEQKVSKTILDFKDEYGEPIADENCIGYNDCDDHGLHVVYNFVAGSKHLILRFTIEEDFRSFQIRFKRRNKIESLLKENS